MDPEEISLLSGTDRMETLQAEATADRAPGDVQIINGRVCVAYATIANGETGSFVHGCEHAEAESADTDAAAAGKAAYWDDGTKQVTTDETGNTKCGMFLEAITDGERAAFRLDNSVTV